mgnify:CR=1 FL=1
MKAASIASHRFGFSEPRLAAVQSDPRGWVLDQFRHPANLDSAGLMDSVSALQMTREVLKGEVALLLRVPSEAPKRGRTGRVAKAGGGREKPAPIALDDDGQRRYAALKAWRAEVAREHNLPAYVVFHDATLAEMARSVPATLDELAGISGVGTTKLERYGAEILRVLASPA